MIIKALERTGGQRTMAARATRYLAADAQPKAERICIQIRAGESTGTSLRAYISTEQQKFSAPGGTCSHGQEFSRAWKSQSQV